MYYNANKLKARLIENDYSVNDMAKELEIHPATLGHKMQNGNFKRCELYKIKEVLHMRDEDFLNIFFAA